MKKHLLLIISIALLTLSSCKREPVRVACVGDSITFGHGIKDRDHDTYPAILGAKLGERYDVRNFGVSGTTTMMGTDMPYMNEKAYQDALDFNPQIVTIKLGTNDSKPYNWKESEHFKQDLKTLIESFRALPAKPQIWLMLPVPAYGHAWSINDSIIYNGVIPYIREVAQEENLPLVDLNTPLQGKKQYFPDTIHPNEEGQQVIADIVFENVFKR
jgi:lysophospholipase L1-like esterase